MISNHVYSPTLPNWQAVKSEFGLKIREPRFVYCVDAVEATRSLSILVYSRDGVSFDTSFALAYMPRIRSPIASDGYEVTIGWLQDEDVAPLITPHIPAFAAWLTRVKPAAAEEDPIGLAREWLCDIASGAVQPWVSGSSLGRSAMMGSPPL